MVDALQTAAVTGLSLRPGDPTEPKIKSSTLKQGDAGSFDRMIEGWFPLTYMINNLNRGLGLQDGYPFVLSTSVLTKLRFIHDTIENAAA
jgi:hypothetical protein